MGKRAVSDPEKEITNVLKKESRDWLTVKQITDKLPPDVLKQVGLTKKSSVADVLKKLRPYLGGSLQNYKGSRTSYIGYNMSLEEIILNRIKQKPGLSVPQLGKNLPMSRPFFVSVLNTLLEAGTVICSFKERTYTTSLKVSTKVHEIPTAARAETGKYEDDHIRFKEAYDQVRKGRVFVRIHRMREYLNWSRERFDCVLMDLRKDYRVHLHGGDPSTMSEEEVRNSFVDENGILYITLTWGEENNGPG